MNWCAEQIMKVSYYELHYEVVTIKGFSMRSTI